MTVEDRNVIDFISLTRDEREVHLTVSDHLDWTDIDRHRLILQSKLNDYLRFVESGEVYESYPKAKGKRVVIEVIAQYAPNSEGRSFLRRAGVIIEGAGLGFRFRVATLRGMQ